MGLSGISFWELLIVLLVVVLLFGSKRFGSIGADLGAAIRNFQKALADGGDATPSGPAPKPTDAETRSGI